MDGKGAAVLRLLKQVVGEKTLEPSLWNSMAVVLDGLAKEEERIAYILALSYSRNDWNPIDISHAVLSQVI